MSSLNHCQFIGNLGRDPETRSFASGGKVCNLRLACTEKWTKDGERKEKTEWISVAVFQEGLIRVCEQYLRKGSKVYVSGKMVTRKYQAQDGSDRYSTEIALQGFDGKLVMLDKAEGNGGGGSYGGQGDQSSGSAGGYGAGGGYGADMGGDDIPFNWRMAALG